MATHMVAQGVYPLLREAGCAEASPVRSTPKLLSLSGNGRVVIDVGLGSGADEALAAVAKGFVVIAVEPRTANIVSIQRRVQARPALAERVRFIEASFDNQLRQWQMPRLAPPPFGGFAYVLHAAVDLAPGTLYLAPEGNQSASPRTARLIPTACGSIGNLQQEQGEPVPKLTLDAIVPSWVDEVYFIKLDTQGWELRALLGASNLLRSRRRPRYVLYELSPWLMRREGTGSPRDLLYLLPSMGALCFDTTNVYNVPPRQNAPLAAWFDSLDAGRNLSPGFFKRHQSAKALPFGPFENVVCWFPPSASVSPLASVDLTRATTPERRARGPRSAAIEPPILPEPRTLELKRGVVFTLLQDWACRPLKTATAEGTLRVGDEGGVLALERLATDRSATKSGTVELVEFRTTMPPSDAVISMVNEAGAVCFDVSSVNSTIPPKAQHRRALPHTISAMSQQQAPAPYHVQCWFPKSNVSQSHWSCR